MLIDTKGKIAFKGHPAHRQDLEADFDALLKGEELSGKGTANEAKPAAEGEDKKEGEEEERALDTNVCMKEIDDFKTLATDVLAKDEDMVAKAKNMPRSFCVMVFENKYTPNTDKWTGEFSNYRVCVGKKEDVDALAAFFDEKVPAGSWKKNEQYHNI